jgi:hypothetical protein
VRTESTASESDISTTPKQEEAALPTKSEKYPDVISTVPKEVS